MTALSDFASMGANLDVLRRAKYLGWDWYVCSSWCSDNAGLFVVILRRPGSKIGQPKTGRLEEVLAWASAEVGKA